MLAKLPKIDHPNFWTYLELGSDVIACFKVGYYEPVPQEVQEAYQRIESAYDSLKAERELIRKWGGNQILYSPSKQLINPLITNEMEIDFQKTAEATTGWTCVDKWQNQSNGVMGVSIRLRNKRGQDGNEK